MVEDEKSTPLMLIWPWVVILTFLFCGVMAFFLLRNVKVSDSVVYFDNEKHRMIESVNRDLHRLNEKTNIEMAIAKRKAAKLKKELEPIILIDHELNLLKKQIKDLQYKLKEVDLERAKIEHEMVVKNAEERVKLWTDIVEREKVIEGYTSIDNGGKFDVNIGRLYR